MQCEKKLRALNKTKFGYSWQKMKLKNQSLKLAGFFKLKLGANGLPARFKARWVVKGFTQQKGVDYDETYAAVTKATTLKLLMAIIAHCNLEAKQYDIMTAFLYAKIKDHEIYVEQPHGFEETSNHVCFLQKALYGLKQSPLLWFEELTKFLISEGYAPLKQDPCIFQHRIDSIMIAVYVDDLIAISQSSCTIENAARRIENRFKMRSLGDISFYLGCRIIRNREERKIYLVQDAYINQLLEKHHMKDSNTVVTPMEVKNNLQRARNEYESSPNIVKEYQSLIGGLMWPAMQTRADIAYATTQLAKYMNNPTQDHLNAAKRVLRYLKRTQNYGILMTGTDKETPHIEGFTDASYADDKDTAKSTGGYLFTCAGGLISWKSGRQPTVSQSTTEAEYISAALAAKEAAYISSLADEIIFLRDVRPITIFGDNEASITLAHKPIVDGRTKHINVKYHYLRQEVANEAIKLVWIPTKDQSADGLTKPLSRSRHEIFCKQIGLIDCTTIIMKADDG